MRLRKGDRVQVLSGKERGRQGEIVRSLPGSGKVIVGGINTARRHTKPRSATTEGGIVDKDMPMHVSTVAIVCPACGPTRIGAKVDEQGRKGRVCRKCGVVL